MYMTPGKTIPFSRESSLPRDQTQVPFQGDSLPSEPQEAPFHIHGKALKISNLRSLSSVISSNLLMFDYKTFFPAKTLIYAGFFSFIILRLNPFIKDYTMNSSQFKLPHLKSGTLSSSHLIIQTEAESHYGETL